MNAKIKELIDACTTTSVCYFDGRGNVSETYFDKYKFAELIVRECAKVTDDHLIPNHPITGALYNGVQSVKIKEYFGIK